jgi:hypothetical protein
VSRSGLAPGAAPGWPRLTVNTPGDAFEREAERVADAVMRGVPAGGAVRGGGRALRRCACGGTCPACREEEEAGGLRRAEDRGAAPSPAFAPPIVHHVLASAGQPLEAGVRTRMEERIGADFGAVRVHADTRAGESARAVRAHAYTVGRDVVFGAGRYAPGTAHGDRLIAHELAHVVQQETGAAPALRRQFEHFGGVATPDPMSDPRMHPPGAPRAVSCAPPGDCPPTFCQPYSSASFAIYQRTQMLTTLLGGIAAFVSPRVVPLWHTYLLGGSALRNLSAQFGADFTNSSTTARTTGFLRRAMAASLRSSPPTIPVAASTITVDFSTRLAAQLAAIDDPASPNQMNFNIPGEIPGNLAGGIGKDETACPAGAMPSPNNDQRSAAVTATIGRTPSGDLQVQPSIQYTVLDTIDLCPGDCGTGLERVATVPMSQFEATGISGDVPLIVLFPAPAALMTPFTVTPPAPPAPVPPGAGSGTVPGSLPKWSPIATPGSTPGP